MNGNYSYAPILFTLSRIEQSQGKIVQRFIDGDYEANASTSKPLYQGLPKGEYLLIYKAEFTEEHPMRKLTISIYADDPVELQRVSRKDYPAEFVEAL